jgi:hypothetical protein
VGFDPGEPAAAAIFVRAGFVYVVFDRPIARGASAPLTPWPANVGAVQPVAVAEATAFRFPLPALLQPRPLREGNVWRIQFFAGAAPAAPGVKIEPQPDYPLGARLLVRADDAASVIPLADPEVGDTLLVVPLSVAGQGVPEQFEYSQANLLPTVQGLVFRP